MKESIQRGDIWAEIWNIKFEISQPEPGWERQGERKGSEEGVLRPEWKGARHILAMDRRPSPGPEVVRGGGRVRAGAGLVPRQRKTVERCPAAG